MTKEQIGIILGVLGFFISVYNLVSAIRHRTVKAQPELLAELRGYLDTAVRECRQVKVQLDFDRYLLHTGHRPEIRPRPAEFDKAIDRMPELGFTVTSIGQRQIEVLLSLIRDVTYNWDLVKSCMDADPVNMNGLDFAKVLRRRCVLVERFFPDYVNAITRINKGNLWKRYRYRDHREFVYKLFRWKPLNQAVWAYDERERQRE